MAGLRSKQSSLGTTVYYHHTQSTLKGAGTLLEHRHRKEIKMLHGFGLRQLSPLELCVRPFAASAPVLESGVLVRCVDDIMFCGYFDAINI